MEQTILTAFSNPELIQAIQRVSKQYHFSIEDNIQLKSLLLSVFLITRKKESIDQFFSLIAKQIILHKSFDEIISQIINCLFQDINDFTYARTILQNYIIDGYCFHSFNGAFFENIQENGLKVKEKPWESEEIEKIRNIFLTHHQQSVFGFYQNKKETPIFFASSLKSSSFYAYSSPAWYRNFVSGGISGNPSIYEKQAFFSRNYDQAKKNVQLLCEHAQLNSIETEQTMIFFQKYWDLFATDQLPYIALIKREDITKNNSLLPALEGENALNYTKRMITYYGSNNYMTKESIPRERLILFPYDFHKIAMMESKTKII